jgi:hypothetical protein
LGFALPKNQRFPKLGSIVVSRHIMGNCISRLLLTDSGNQLWMKIFGQPPDELPLSLKRANISGRNCFFVTVRRVIFIAAALRGSNMATGL